MLAVDATVVDEGRTFEGLAAITAWKIEVKRKCADTVEPLKGGFAAQLRKAGVTVLTMLAPGPMTRPRKTCSWRRTSAPPRAAPPWPTPSASAWAAASDILVHAIGGSSAPAGGSHPGTCS